MHNAQRCYLSCCTECCTVNLPFEATFPDVAVRVQRYAFRPPSPTPRRPPRRKRNREQPVTSLVSRRHTSLASTFHTVLTSHDTVQRQSAQLQSAQLQQQQQHPRAGTRLSLQLHLSRLVGVTFPKSQQMSPPKQNINKTRQTHY